MKWVEKLNFATGFILVTVGVLNFIKGANPAGFNWLIFGSMYLVMDSYQIAHIEQKFDHTAIRLRKIFALVGFGASAILLLHTIF